MICQHCRAARSTRPRRLCWTCYYTPGVRELYPTTSKFGRRGPGSFNGTMPLPTFPTAARPGTPEKIAALEERVRLKQSLWHPHDADFSGAAPTIARAG